MDIYAYLHKDHQKVSELMQQLLDTPDAEQRQALFEQIKTELSLHAESEEQTFYKAVEDATRAKPVEELMEEAEHEHDEIRQYLDKLSTLSITEEAWIETFGELKHAVSHHVEEEEERVFEKAKKYIDDDQAKQLTKDMQALKKELMSQMEVPAGVLGAEQQTGSASARKM